LNVAVAEKVQECGQRSVHCVEGYLLFARAIISYLDSNSQPHGVDGMKEASFDVAELQNVPVWSSCSDDDNVQAVGQANPLDATIVSGEDAEIRSSRVASSVPLGTNPIEKKELSSVDDDDEWSSNPSAMSRAAQEGPERDAWRLLRRCEEILTAEHELPQVNQTGLHVAAQLAKVRELLRWFDISAAPGPHNAVS
jgi:hypothetical protein